MKRGFLYELIMIVNCVGECTLIRADDNHGCVLICCTERSEGKAINREQKFPCDALPIFLQFAPFPLF